jgi:phage gp29-like protein
MQLKGRRRVRESRSEGAGSERATNAAVKSAPTDGGTVLTIKQVNVNVPTTWDIKKVNAAIALHEDGDFSQSAVLADAMGRDDRIGGCLSTRVNALASKNGLDFSIVPPEKGPQALADQVAEWWPKVVTNAVLKALLGDMVLLGLAIARLHWELSDKEWKLTRIERWHLSNVRWDINLERFVTTSASGSQIVIEPGDHSWLVMAPGGDRSWMSGGIRALGLPFVMRSFTWRDWGNYNERHGAPIIAIQEPRNGDKAMKEAFYQQLKTLGRNGIIRLPQVDKDIGFKADFLEAKDRAFETFPKFRGDLDIGIAVYLLGQNLTTEVTGGSYAAADVHDRVRNDYLAADEDGAAEPLRDQVISPWCMFNVRGFKLEDAPWPQWDTSLPEDLKGEAETLNVLGDAVTKLETAGFPVDGDEIAARYGLPLRKGEKYTKPEPVVVAPLDPNADPKQKPPAKKKADEKAAASAKQMPLMIATNSGVPVAANSGFVNGQQYADELAENGTAAAGKAHEAGFLTVLLEAVRGASKSDDPFGETRKAVLKAYGDALPPEQLRDIQQKMMVLADLAGAAAVREDAT